MGTPLTQELVTLLDDEKTTKVLATIDGHGFPHVVSGLPIFAGEQGNLLYLEYFESSVTNRNLTRSIWFDGNVAIALSNSAGKSFQIKGRPIKNHITGPLFLTYYQKIRAAQGNVNLAAVWEIEPLEIINEGQEAQREYESTTRPFFTHLDRIVR
jgi:hypothetical protein